MADPGYTVVFIHHPLRAHKVLCLLDGVRVVKVASVGDILRCDRRELGDACVVVNYFGRWGVLGMLAALWLRKPLVIRLRGEYFREEHLRCRTRRGVLRWPRLWFNLLLGNLCFRMARLVLVNSRYIQEAMAPWLRGKRTAVVYNPYTPPAGEVGPVSFALPTQGLRLLTVTDFQFEPKIAPLVEAIEGGIPDALWEELDITWVICGDGPVLDLLRRAVADRGLEKRVILTGRTNEVQGILAWSHVQLYLTRLDAFPNATMEAMMAGKPVITNEDSCGTREQVVDGENGFVVRDAEELSEALRRYAADAELRARHGAAARATVEQLFTVPVQAKAMQEALAALFDGDAGR